MDRLANKVAIITGAGSGTGMGAETARLFAREGARVVVTDLHQEPLEELAGEITAAGGSALALTLDVTQEDQWAAAVARTLEAFGTIDILVNNAGTSGPPVGWAEATLAEVNQIVGVNLNSQFLGIKSVVPTMAENGGGSIVNLSSAAAIIAFPDVHPGYTASKGASRLLTKSAAVDFARQGIRVNSVHPGLIETPMSVHFSQNEEILEMLLPRIPLHRMGSSREIANAVLFLASDESSYVTGTELVVDGGYTTI